jgi:hypothetical protein
MAASLVRGFHLVELTAGDAAAPSDGMRRLFIDAKQPPQVGALL